MGLLHVTYCISHLDVLLSHCEPKYNGVAFVVLSHVSDSAGVYLKVGAEVGTLQKVTRLQVFHVLQLSRHQLNQRSSAEVVGVVGLVLDGRRSTAGRRLRCCSAGEANRRPACPAATAAAEVDGLLGTASRRTRLAAASSSSWHLLQRKDLAFRCGNRPEPPLRRRWVLSSAPRSQRGCGGGFSVSASFAWRRLLDRRDGGRGNGRLLLQRPVAAVASSRVDRRLTGRRPVILEGGLTGRMMPPTAAPAAAKSRRPGRPGVRTGRSLKRIGSGGGQATVGVLDHLGGEWQDAVALDGSLPPDRKRTQVSGILDGRRAEQVRRKMADLDEVLGAGGLGQRYVGPLDDRDAGVGTEARRGRLALKVREVPGGGGGRG